MAKDPLRSFEIEWMDDSTVDHYRDRRGYQGPGWYMTVLFEDTDHLTEPTDPRAVQVLGAPTIRLDPQQMQSVLDTVAAFTPPAFGQAVRARRLRWRERVATRLAYLDRQQEERDRLAAQLTDDPYADGNP